MRNTIKSTFFTLLGVLLFSLGYSQSEAELYMLQLLEEEKIEKVDSDFTNLDNAMKVLDARKADGSITETEFQSNLSKLMVLRSELREKSIQEKMALSEKNTKEYLAKKERGETTDMFDLAKTRLKEKLEKGKISQSQYDDKLAYYNKRQAERKAEKNN